MSTSILATYDPQWPLRFEQEKELILAVAGQYIERVEHVGSTSVPGMTAKPILDMLVGLSDLAQAELCIEPLQAIGYGYCGVDPDIPGWHFFRKPDIPGWEKRLVNMHMVEVGNREWHRMLFFRNYLRTHPDIAQEYLALKETLARQFAGHSNISQLYPKGKNGFVSAILERAQQEDWTQ